MYLVDSKTSEFVVRVPGGIIFFLLQHQNCLATSHRYTFTFHWLFRVQLVTNSDLQISKVIALNSSFVMFSGKISAKYD